MLEILLATLLRTLCSGIAAVVVSDIQVLQFKTNFENSHESARDNIISTSKPKSPYIFRARCAKETIVFDVRFEVSGCIDPDDAMITPRCVYSRVPLNFFSPEAGGKCDIPSTL